jgi:hypothetical protein
LRLARTARATQRNSCFEKPKTTTKINNTHPRLEKPKKKKKKSPLKLSADVQQALEYA